MTGWEGGIAQDKEELWEYDIPPLAEAITTIVVSLDGAYALMRDDGYREAMVGNISLYDVTGKRQHTVYIGEALEYGKGTFFHTVLQLMVGRQGRGLITLVSTISSQREFQKHRAINKQHLDIKHMLWSRFMTEN